MKISIVGNYVVVVNSDDVEIFSAPVTDTKILNNNGNLKLYNETAAVENYQTLDIDAANLTDAAGDPLTGGALVWLRTNLGLTQS